MGRNAGESPFLKGINMKSSRYRKFHASRYLFPTKLINNVLDIGHSAARKDIENRIGRKLKDGTKIKKTTGEWIFCEPKDNN